MQTAESVDGTRIAYRTVGSGEGMIVVGGAMRSAADYMPLAEALSKHFLVHVIDRRGRGLSGGLAPGYSLEKECDDLRAVQAATGATIAFGHSYGGLVVLETAAAGDCFRQLALYEPAVSVGGSIATAWMPRYGELLRSGDTRRAFAEFVRGSGHAPAIVSVLPRWYLRSVLRLMIRRPQWELMEPLLEANALEHAEVAKRNDTWQKYRSIRARVLMLAGERSPAHQNEVLRELAAVLSDGSYEAIAGLDHNAPDEKAPAVVAEHLAMALSDAALHP
jgi:pimeloyl-ACP methyl ester carboxylesterase